MVFPYVLQKAALIAARVRRNSRDCWSTRWNSNCKCCTVGNSTNIWALSTPLRLS